MNNAATILWLARIRQKGADSAQAVVTKTWVQFGQAIRKSRRARKISLRVFAKRLKVTHQMLSYMESGERRWTFDRAELAVKLLTRKDEWPD